MSLSDALAAVRSATAGEHPEELLFRGEPDLYPNTFSSHHRLFERSNRFTEGQAKAVEERLALIANVLEIVLQAKPVFSSRAAAANARPSTVKEIYEVRYCFMQHYHLPTDFVDVTTDLGVAAAFASDIDEDDAVGNVKSGALYVIRRRKIGAYGIKVFDPVSTRADRPNKQQAASLYLKPGVDLQQIPSDAIERFTFVSSADERARTKRPDLLDAHGDEVAAEVARLTYRCAHGDWAPEDPSAGRVIEFFSNIAYMLADAGAVPRAN